MEQIRALGIDLATQVFHLVGVNSEGEMVLKRQLRRARLAEFMVRLPELPERQIYFTRESAIAFAHG